MPAEDDSPAVSDHADEKPIKSLVRKKKQPRANGAMSKPAAVKKEEPQPEDEGEVDNKPLAEFASGRKVKKEESLGGNVGEGSALSRKKIAKVKKEEEDEEGDVDSKAPSKARRLTSKTVQKEEKKTTTGKVKKVEKVVKEVNVRLKKVYDLPGQKHEPPEKRDPSRIFYESLHEQTPGSQMAAIWMMERGLLPRDEAEKVYYKKFNKTPEKVKSVKSVTTKVTIPKASKSKTNVVSKSASKSAKRKLKSDDSSEDDEDDFVPDKK